MLLGLICTFLQSLPDATFVEVAVTLTAVDVTCKVQNLWRKNEKVREFIQGQRLGRIAAELMGVNYLDSCMKHLLSFWSTSQYLSLQCQGSHTTAACDHTALVRLCVIQMP